ncbi:hypothetical protein BH09VER1_BH09VER1_50610 [soil metagenome]
MRAEREDGGGFTLIELLVSMVVVSVLTAIAATSYATVMDRANKVKCLGNMRSILGGVAAFTADRNGKLWTRTEVGYSKYRMVDDPLGLPALLQDYVPNKRVWLCPAGRKALAIFGNNYTWNATVSFEEDNAYASPTVRKTLVLWDTYAYSLPSMKGASEDYKGDGTSSTGPTALSSKYYIRPHNGNTTVNWGFIDGHVINGATAAQ